MARAYRISEETQQEMMRMYKDGMTAKQICRRLGYLSPSSIGYWIRKLLPEYDRHKGKVVGKRNKSVCVRLTDKEHAIMAAYANSKGRQLAATVRHCAMKMVEMDK